MKILFYSLSFIIMIISCKKTDTGSGDGFMFEKKVLNEPYGGDTAQKMDIYLPAGRSLESTPVIVLLHGGGWNSGNKSDLNSYIDTFKKRTPGYAVINMNYRLATDKNKFPAQEEDVKKALDFVYNSAGHFGYNKNKIALLGVSAGAHLALLHSYKNASGYSIAAVIDFFGPTDLERMYTQPWHPLIPTLLYMVTGGSFSDNPGIYKNSSPVNFVNADSTPTLILHGEKDNIVDVSQSILLKQKLEQYNVQHELIIYPQEGHGWYGKNMSHSFDRIEAFLKAQLD
jgi:acetyl esterase/lipase